MTAAPIAILQTAFLGDTLLTLPLARALKASAPDRRLAIIVRRGLKELLTEYRLFDHVIEIEKGSSASYAAAHAELEAWWPDTKSRILLSPHESPRSKLFAAKLRWRSGVTTIGYRDRWPEIALSRLAYTERVSRPMHLPEALRQLALLTCAKVGGTAAAELWQKRLDGFTHDQALPGGREASGGLLPVPEWATMDGSQSFAPAVSDVRAQGEAKMAVLAPGSVWATKQWAQAGFVEVGRKLRLAGYEIALVGSKAEQTLCDSIAEAVSSGDGSHVKSHAGRLSLLETLRVIARADVAIVNDSGAMHMAASVGTPIVAVFGPTVLDFGYRPWSSRAKVVEPELALTCRPCGPHGAQRCPIGTHVCMTSIGSARVLAAARGYL